MVYSYNQDLLWIKTHTNLASDPLVLDWVIQELAAQIGFLMRVPRSSPTTAQLLLLDP